MKQQPEGLRITLLILLLLLLLALIPKPVLLPIPTPIPSSHNLTSGNKKNFLTRNLSLGVSNSSTNANLGALVYSGALSHKCTQR